MPIAYEKGKAFESVSTAKGLSSGAAEHPPLERPAFFWSASQRMPMRVWSSQKALFKENAMKKRLYRIWWALTTLLLLAPSWALAAGGKGAPVVIVADTRKLEGMMAWWANLYNESHFYFTVATVVMIPVVGMLFGILADIVMNWIGIDLKSRELAE
jgi:hypothetical protein